MKNVALICILLSAFSATAKADCYPERWKLPNKGQACEFITDFGTPANAKLWNCTMADSSKSLFLMTGRTVKQPVDGDICFLVDKLQEQVTNPIPQ